MCYNPYLPYLVEILQLCIGTQKGEVTPNPGKNRLNIPVVSLTKYRETAHPTGPLIAQESLIFNGDFR